VVLTVIFVPGLAFWAVNDSINTWSELDKMAIQTCVNEEGPPNFDVDGCIHRAGAGQTMFQHEHVTPGRYWSEALGFAFLVDLILTALVTGLFLVGRWVVRGFRDGRFEG
jgi:hypothetical protein